MGVITYDDKQAMGTQPTIPDVNKVTADDMNEIKNVVNDFNPVVLYNNPSGSNGSITLSDSVANYSYIDIFYKSNDDYIGSKRIPAMNCSTELLAYQSNASSEDAFYIKVRVVSISGTSITTRGQSNNYYKEVLLSSNGVNIYPNNYIYIIKVVGYK